MGSAVAVVLLFMSPPSFCRRYPWFLRNSPRCAPPTAQRDRFPRCQGCSDERLALLWPAATIGLRRWYCYYCAHLPKLRWTRGRLPRLWSPPRSSYRLRLVRRSGNCASALRDLRLSLPNQSLRTPDLPDSVLPTLGCPAAESADSTLP